MTDLAIVAFPASIFRRVEYLRVHMSDGLSEAKERLTADDWRMLQERNRGYSDAISDVLDIMRSLTMEHPAAASAGQERDGQK